MSVRRAVFFISPQTRSTLQTNAPYYRKLASGGLVGGINTYLYANAAPTGYTDPDGLAVPAVIWAGIVAVARITAPRIVVPVVTRTTVTKAAGALVVAKALDNAREQKSSECDRLNRAVQDAKNRVGDFKPAKCLSGMTKWELTQRRNAWLHLATTRAIRDQKCWGGGDEGHQGAQADAWMHVGNCNNLLAE